MGTAERKFKSEGQRLFHSSKDWGWMFSHKLCDAVVAKTGMPRREVEKLLKVIGKEMRELLVTGNPVGLPYAPVVYGRRSGNRRINGKVVRNVARARVYTSQPFRDEMHAQLIDRGTVRTQYDAERRRVTGFKGLAFRAPYKNQNQIQRTVGSTRR